MDIKELRLKQPQELRTLLAEARSRLHDLRVKAATNQLAKVHEISAVRRQVAQIETLLAEKPAQTS